MWMTKSSLFGVALLISCQLVACTGTIAGQEAFEGENEPLVEVSAPTLAQEEQQVRYGVDDGEAHPSVVKLIMRVGNAYSLCSGSVIHESAILTAAHCIDRVAAASDVSAIINEVSYEASEIYIHPEYDATAPHVRFSEGDYYRFSAADIAVLKFDGVLPAPTIDLSNLPGQKGEALTIVGFGNNENMVNGIRRNGQVEYVAAVPTYLSDKVSVDQEQGSIITNPGPTEQTVCRGDSGGALIYNGELLGVTSGGVVNNGIGNLCVLFRNANFISVPAYLPWISQYVDLAPQPEPAPEEEEPAPEEEEPAPEEEEPAPEEEEPAPEEEEPAPEEEEPAPEEEEPAPQENVRPIGEYGRATINSEWLMINLDSQYQDPVVIISDPQTDEVLMSSARIRNLSNSSFEVMLQQPNAETVVGQDLQAEVTYLVIESGQWYFEGGIMIQAGHFASDKLSTQGFNRVNLSGFSETPVTLTQVQSYNGADFVVTRTSRQTARSFDVTMQEEELLNGRGHERETIGWVAVSSSREGAVVAGVSPRRVTHSVSNVSLGATFSNPSIIVKLNSYYGRDTANVRVASLSQGSFTAQVMEDRSADRERRHARESLSFLALEGESGPIMSSQEQPEPPAPQTFGEYGQVTITQEWQTIMTQHTYEDPVVVVSDPAAQGGVAITIRLRSVGSDSFEARLESAVEGDTLAPSTVSFMVMESGEWITASGARMIAGHRETSRLNSRGFDVVTHQRFNRGTVAFTHVQTYNEGGWLTTRMRRQNARSFQVAMQEAELTNSGEHAVEELGWIVIERGAHDLGDSSILTMTTPRVFSHAPVQINFTQGFEARPTLLSKLGSTYGRDSANISVSEAGASGFVAIVAEERSRDEELGHAREQLSFIALSSVSGSFVTP